MKIKSFTLAEVLTTIGIIGIVAAMTLPNIINKAEKYILKNQFRKTYSVLQQALLKSQADLGYKPACFYIKPGGKLTTTSNNQGGIRTECLILSQTLMKNLNIIAHCKNNAYPTCIPKYKGFDTIKLEDNPDMTEDEVHAQLNGIKSYWQSNILYKNPVYVLADGQIVFSGTYTTIDPALFAVDINGKKGPNKWGYDLFIFNTLSDDISDLQIGALASYPVEKGGVTTHEMIKQMHDK